MLGVVAALVLFFFAPVLEVPGGKYQVCSGYRSNTCTSVTTYGSIGFVTICIGSTYQTGVNVYSVRLADCATSIGPNPPVSSSG